MLVNLFVAVGVLAVMCLFMAWQLDNTNERVRLLEETQGTNTHAKR